MGLRINTNIDAFDAHRNLQSTSDALSKSMQRLSSGLRINSAADDAAGLGISERMKGQIGGLAQATRNAQDGMSLVQTAEGSMSEMQAILHRVRDLAVQYMNGTNDVNAQAAITAEVGQLGQELQRMISQANFNGTALLTGTNPATAPLLTLQVGPNGTASDQLGVPAVSLDTMAAVTLGNVFSNFTSGVTTNLITNIDALNDGMSAARATYGAIQNRLEHTVNSLGIYQENLMSAQSRIADVDMASEMTNMTKLQVLQESGTAMLAQANQSSQSVLSLLQH